MRALSPALAILLQLLLDLLITVAATPTIALLPTDSSQSYGDRGINIPSNILSTQNGTLSANRWHIWGTLMDLDITFNGPPIGPNLGPFLDRVLNHIAPKRASHPWDPIPGGRFRYCRSDDEASTMVWQGYGIRINWFQLYKVYETFMLNFGTPQWDGSPVDFDILIENEIMVGHGSIWKGSPSKRKREDIPIRRNFTRTNHTAIQA